MNRRMQTGGCEQEDVNGMQGMQVGCEWDVNKDVHMGQGCPEHSRMSRDAPLVQRYLLIQKTSFQ